MAQMKFKSTLEYMMVSNGFMRILGLDSEP